MNELPEGPAEEIGPPQRPRVDLGRRRLGTLGAGGTAVLLSVASKSAVAGWGTCTGSELASGNLSRGTDSNPCGCSPGFWWNKNGDKLWTTIPTLYTAYPQTAKFNQIFGFAFYTNANTKLIDVGPSTKVKNFCDANNNTGMHAVAALLNAQYYGARYPVSGLQTAAAVVQAFKDACNTVGDLRAKRNALGAFVERVDIYAKTANLWCSGESKG